VLVLSRKVNQAIMIGDDVRIVIVAVDRDQVKLGVEAPREISVHRSEIYDEIKRTGRSTAQERRPAQPIIHKNGS
jgi:carbon storage regulator